MKILYLDCAMGAAGDMLTAALSELLPDKAAFIERFNRLGIPGVQAALDPAVKCGVTGTHFRVSVDGVEEDEHLHEHDHGHTHHHDDRHAHDHDHPHHPHSGLHDVEHIVKALGLDPETEADVLAVYRLLAEAESKVHGTTVDNIHFHEVGTMDAVADVTAVCLLLHELAPDEIVASPVNVGGGTVRCAHGVLPVPAPATAELLRGLPVYGGEIESELCTPTGAALLRHFVTRFGALPPMRVSAVGYGMGKKDFPRANCLRAMLGESGEDGAEEVIELSCDIDDMTGEALGFAAEQLLAAGALDVVTSAVQMKKGRPGVLLRVLCRENTRKKLTGTIFRCTSTLGVREARLVRRTLSRESETLDTPFGPVRRKRSVGYDAETAKYEYDDLARIARERGVSLEEARRLVREAAE